MARTAVGVAAPAARLAARAPGRCPRIRSPASPPSRSRPRSARPRSRRAGCARPRSSSACRRARSAGPTRSSASRPKVTTANRRWPRAVRCRAASKAAARSSMPTVGRPVSRGWSMITVGSGRAAASSGSRSPTEYTTTPSTAALGRSPPLGTSTSPRPLLLGHRAQPGHHRRRGRVVERVRQRRVADQPDRARTASAQPAASGSGPA